MAAQKAGRSNDCDGPVFHGNSNDLLAVILGPLHTPAKRRRKLIPVQGPPGSSL
jgi:hypothetical protein